jgi:hypothetical protein
VLIVLCGLPYVLVAATLVRVPLVARVARIIMAAVFACGLMVIWMGGPSEAEARSTHSNVARNTLYTATIPGYRSAVFGVWEPQDPAQIPADRHVTVIAFGRTTPDGCGQVALDSRLSLSECSREPDGMVYRKGIGYHGYQVQQGDVVVEVAGTLAVPREDLRGAVGKVRPEGRLFTTDIAGYQARELGMPPGIMLEPSGPASGRLDMLIMVHLGEAPSARRAPCTGHGPPSAG